MRIFGKKNNNNNNNNNNNKKLEIEFVKNKHWGFGRWWNKKRKYHDFMDKIMLSLDVSPLNFLFGLKGKVKVDRF